MLKYNIFTHFHFCSNDLVVVVVIITDSDRVYVAGITLMLQHIFNSTQFNNLILITMLLIR